MSRRGSARPGALAAPPAGSRVLAPAVPHAAAEGPLWRAALTAARAHARNGRYGPLRAPDENGIAVPEGFTVRVLARSGYKSAGMVWHAAPDGGACFPDGDEWIYVSNSQAPLLGGVSAIRFGAGGETRGAYRILSGTSLNGAGCATPWHTWLSGESMPGGRVFECDPYGTAAAMPRLSMGRLTHRSMACDPDRRVVYLTEDEPDGCFYRFVPDEWGDLTSGTLQVLITGPDGSGPVVWRRVPNPAAVIEPARYQVPGARRFDRPAGCHYADGVCRFVTADGRVWCYDAAGHRLEAAGDPAAAAPPSRTGDVFVAGAEMTIDVLHPDGTTSPFLRVAGHDSSVITGMAFSPDGRHLYFSSQRGATGAVGGTGGVTFAVTGPFGRGGRT
jgi:Predicted phosphatase